MCIMGLSEREKKKILTRDRQRRQETSWHMFVTHRREKKKHKFELF